MSRHIKDRVEYLKSRLQIAKAEYEAKKARRLAPAVAIIIISLLSLGYLALVPQRTTARVVGLNIINIPVVVAFLAIIGVSFLMLYKKMES